MILPPSRQPTGRQLSAVEMAPHQPAMSIGWMAIVVALTASPRKRWATVPRRRLPSSRAPGTASSSSCSIGDESE